MGDDRGVQPGTHTVFGIGIRESHSRTRTDDRLATSQSASRCEHWCIRRAGDGTLLSFMGDRLSGGDRRGQQARVRTSLMKEVAWTFRGPLSGAAGSSSSIVVWWSPRSCWRRWASTASSRQPRAWIARPSGSTRSSAARWSSRCGVPGTLVPERIRYISAVTAGRVERRLAEAGQEVKAGDRAPRAEQSRRAARGARVRAPAHRLPCRPGEPSRQPHLAAALPGSPGRRVPAPPISTPSGTPRPPNRSWPSSSSRPTRPAGPATRSRSWAPATRSSRSAWR